jgi:hypothetical protein
MSNVGGPQSWWGEAPEGPTAVARAYDRSLRLVTLGRKIRRAVGLRRGKLWRVAYQKARLGTIYSLATGKTVNSLTPRSDSQSFGSLAPPT